MLTCRAPRSAAAAAVLAGWLRCPGARGRTGRAPMPRRYQPNIARHREPPGRPRATGPCLPANRWPVRWRSPSATHRSGPRAGARWRCRSVPGRCAGHGWRAGLRRPGRSAPDHRRRSRNPRPGPVAATAAHCHRRPSTPVEPAGWGGHGPDRRYRRPAPGPGSTPAGGGGWRVCGNQACWISCSPLSDCLSSRVTNLRRAT